MSGDSLDDADEKAWRELQSRNQKPYDGVMGELPNWIPQNFCHEFHVIRNRLLATYSHDDLLYFISEMYTLQTSAAANTESAPNYRPFTPAVIFREVSILTHLKAATGLGPEKGMALLTDSNHAASAILGGKFRDGRKPGTGSLIRKAIAKLLAKNPTMKNPELWDALSKKPPSGWAFFDNRTGKYFEGPENVEMKKGRFDTVCGEERKKLKK